MAIQDDFSIDYGTKKISHTAGTTRYTVNALYSWLMDLFDDAGQMDDTVPMSAQTPVEYTLVNGWTFNADSDLGYLYGGSIVVEKAGSNRDVWANFYTLGTIESDGVVYLQQNGALVAAYPGYTQGHADQLVKVVSGGSDVDSRNITAFLRNCESGNADLYDHFTSQGTSTGGRVPIPLATSPDANDDGSGAAVTGVTVSFGSVSKDIGDGSGGQPYDVVVDGGGNTVLDVYQRLKYLTRRQNTSAVGSGTSVQGRFYRSANGAYLEVKQAPFGAFAGGKFFGARGIWLENVSDGNNLQLIDANGVTRSPPTTVSIVVSGVQVGDRVLVARDDGAGAIDKSQFTLNGVHSGAATVTVNEALAADIPDSGILRIGDVRHTYAGIVRGSKQFTGVSPGLSGANGAGLYQPYVDDVAAGTSMAKSFVYAADFDIIARVRKKGILPFENSGTVTVAGASISAIRTADTIVV